MRYDSLMTLPGQVRRAVLTIVRAMADTDRVNVTVNRFDLDTLLAYVEASKISPEPPALANRKEENA